MWIEETGDISMQCTKVLYIIRDIDTTQVLRIRSSRILKRQECNRNIWPAPGIEEVILVNNFCAKGYCVCTVGLNKEETKQYVR